MFFRKKPATRTFDDVLSTLGSQGFDVSSASQASVSGAKRVSKYGCAAEIAPSRVDPKAEKGTTPQPAEIVTRGGYVINGQIARIEDRGYQKFLKAGKLEIAATADALRAIHKFSEELKEAAGSMSLYNESLGTTSDTYVYDRVKGREHHDEAHGKRLADPLQRSTAVATAPEDDANDL
ncbi:hypothetical protein [Terriglobus aquaticus]|uniref:Uncharacterized protein n=1 Tax=Terriglobus aquaticus TaxID=940139 RepID=A0ABW9KPD2_9BACT|nr:hypothetical protein [Terriglobus aquaticus]